jgi:hypothetical protein
MTVSTNYFGALFGSLKASISERVKPGQKWPGSLFENSLPGCSVIWGNYPGVARKFVHKLGYVFGFTVVSNRAAYGYAAECLPQPLTR